MTTQTFKPDGRLHSESKNLRGLLNNARRRGIKRVVVTEIRDSRYDVHVTAHYLDGFFSLTNFADAGICREFMEKRWPGLITYRKEA